MHVLLIEENNFVPEPFLRLLNFGGYRADQVRIAPDGLRTCGEHSGRWLQVGDLRLDHIAKIAQRGGKRLALSPAEYRVLERLALNLGKVVPAAHLAQESGFAPDPLDDPLDYCLSSLTYKLQASSRSPVIRQTAGGYVMEAPHSLGSTR